MTKYRISTYPEAKVGKHYSVDFEVNGVWFVRQLFWTKKEASEILKQLNRLEKPIDNS